MSAIAEFRLIEKSKLEDLEKASRKVIIKGFLKRKVEDNYSSFIESNTRRLYVFGESGYIFGNLLVFLQERKEVNLLNSEYDEIANEITRQRDTSTFFFTKKHKDDYLKKLNARDFTLEELILFNKEFSEDNDLEFAQAEIKGIQMLKSSLESIPNDNYLVIMTVS